jgi:hypothetical protein
VTAPDAAVASALAREHGAVTLAEALAARLLADGRAELAAALASLLNGAAIDPNPPDPHREANQASAIDPNPPDPHRGGST